MLAYVFWHRPCVGVSAVDYEFRLYTFHRELNVCSASFRIDALPFAEGGGYEDWYLVEGWAGLGALNLRATSGGLAPPHDAVAHMAAEGWGAVYALVRGDRRPPVTTLWLSKPRRESYEHFLSGVRAPTIWQRQMVLGPAPEFCLVEDERDARTVRADFRALIYPAAVVT